MDGSRSELAGSRYSAVAKLPHLRKHQGRSPDPSKTYPDHGAMVAGLAGQFRYVTKYKGGSGGDQAGTTAAPWRGARPFDGRPGASRLFGGRCRATCPRC